MRKHELGLCRPESEERQELRALNITSCLKDPLPRRAFDDAPHASRRRSQIGEAKPIARAEQPGACLCMRVEDAGVNLVFDYETPCDAINIAPIDVLHFLEKTKELPKIEGALV